MIAGPGTERDLGGLSFPLGRFKRRMADPRSGVPASWRADERAAMSGCFIVMYSLISVRSHGSINRDFRFNITRLSA
jgi:hypothetical protein